MDDLDSLPRQDLAGCGAYLAVAANARPPRGSRPDEKAIGRRLAAIGWQGEEWASAFERVRQVVGPAGTATGPCSTRPGREQGRRS